MASAANLTHAFDYAVRNAQLLSLSYAVRRRVLKFNFQSASDVYILIDNRRNVNLFFMKIEKYFPGRRFPFFYAVFIRPRGPLFSRFSPSVFLSRVFYRTCAGKRPEGPVFGILGRPAGRPRRPPRVLSVFTSQAVNPPSLKIILQDTM